MIKIRLATLAVATLLLAGCAQLKEKASVLKPTAELTATSLTYLDFERADLEIELAVDNPNPIALPLAGLEYDFRIENQSLVSGTTAQQTEIRARGVSPLTIPVSLKFEDLAALPGELLEGDTIEWQIDTAFNIQLPVIGSYPLKVSKSGQLPVPKLPEIELRSVNIKELGLTSATLEAEIAVTNPNSFLLALSDMEYSLSVAGTQWSDGAISELDTIPAKGEGTVTLPINLKLLSMGSSILNLLKGADELDYAFDGNVSVDTGHELLKTIRMPIDLKGKTSLR